MRERERPMRISTNASFVATEQLFDLIYLVLINLIRLLQK
jgi:hypothetical protein